MKELKKFIFEAKEYNGDSYSKKIRTKIDTLYKEAYTDDITEKVKKFAIKEIKTMYKDIDEISNKIESTDIKTDGWTYLYISESKKLQEIFNKCYDHSGGDKILTISVLNEFNKTTQFNTHVHFVWEDSGDNDLDYYHKIIHGLINWKSDDFEILDSLECILVVREILKYTLNRLENNIPDDVKNTILKDAVKLKGSDFTKSAVPQPQNKNELKLLLDKLIEERGNEGDFNDIDTSLITDMSKLFYEKRDFNGNISKWNVSNVIDMSDMFYGAVNFNGDISKWDVRNAINMSWMFCLDRNFNGDISKWDVRNVIDMTGMFYYAKNFNRNISKWKLNKDCDTTDMFFNCPIKEQYKPVVKQEPVKPVVKQEPVKPVNKLPKIVKDLQTSIQDKKWQTMLDTLKKIVKTYGNKYGELHFTPSGRFWDHHIEGMYLSKNNLYLYIYWAGDSTDGTESVKFIDVWNSSRYIIPAKTYNDGYRTRTTHDDIEVTKNEVIEYINKFINEYDWSKK